MTEIPEGWWPGRNYPAPKNADLEAEVYSTRVNDLIHKLEAVIHEAGNQPEEILPALSNILVTRFSEAGDSDKLFRIFTRMIVDEYDTLMDEIDAGVYDDPDEV